MATITTTQSNEVVTTVNLSKQLIRLLEAVQPDTGYIEITSEDQIELKNITQRVGQLSRKKALSGRFFKRKVKDNTVRIYKTFEPFNS
jgi:hypothetical protein